MELEEIFSEIRNGKLESKDWKKFEKVVEEIFKANDFLVKHRFRFKTKRRYEIDILAIKGNYVLIVECKNWRTRKYKKSKLKAEIEKNENKVKELKKYLEKSFGLDINKKFYSLIITLLEEDLIEFKKTLIIPIFKLNKFLIEIEKYI